MKLINPWVCLGALVACLLSFAAGDRHGHNAEALAGETRQAHADSAVDQAQTKANQQVADAEKYLGRLFDNREAEHQKENDDAEKKIASLRADVAAGRVRFSVAAAGAAGPDADSRDPAAGDREARTELLPETAAAFIDVAAASAGDVRALNSCIDRYNDVRATINTLRLDLAGQIGQ